MLHTPKFMPFNKFTLSSLDLTQWMTGDYGKFDTHQLVEQILSPCGCSSFLGFTVHYC